jgi:mitochondrial import inner membrane translocase subunit TIM44
VPGAVRATLLRTQAFWPRVSYSNIAAFQRLLIQARSWPKFSPSLQKDPQRPTFQFSSLLFTLKRDPFSQSFHSVTGRREQHKQTGKDEDASKSNSTNSDSQSDSGKDESKPEDKTEAPPPPPHGDKTPWQVFTETLRSEFRKSKEWDESTKALASSAHQFTESESVKRARAAYEAASDAASSKTSSALKTTGKAIGQGAAWTWETPVVRGIRKSVTATGKGIEKITRPVRETEAYKTAVGGVKEAIDDGSSSRYGGWVEKEERRRQRQIREQNEAKAGRLRNAEKMEADPK